MFEADFMAWAELVRTAPLTASYFVVLYRMYCIAERAGVSGVSGGPSSGREWRYH